MAEEFSGGCLCGVVRYTARTAPVATGHCHCEDCRRSSGTGHCSHMALPAAAVTVTGKVQTYERPADSGAIVGRAFCPECGAPVYSRNSNMPDMIFLRASSLDDLEVFSPQMSVYASRAASWDPVDPALPSFPEMPGAMPEGMSGSG